MKKIIILSIFALWTSISYSTLNKNFDRENSNYYIQKNNLVSLHDRSLKDTAFDESRLNRNAVNEITNEIVSSCLAPTNLGVSNVTPTNAKLTWQGTATKYTIEYGPRGFTLGTGIKVDNITTKNYIIPQAGIGSLLPNTDYEYFVTSVCADSTTSLAGPFRFKTAIIGSVCSNPIEFNSLPYVTNDNILKYGNYLQGLFPGCATAEAFLSGNDVVYAYKNTTPSNVNITIALDPKGSNNTGVFVYDNCSTFTDGCFDGQANSGSATRVIPEVSVGADQTVYIVLSSNGLLDYAYNLTIQQVKCDAPDELKAVGTGPSKANLSWQNPSGATSWEVFVQLEGQTLPTTNGVTANTNTNFSVSKLTGTTTDLVFGQEYQYWVRANCGGGNFSSWSGPFKFKTPSCTTGCPYTFELTDSLGDGWNGNTMNVIQSGTIVATIGGTFTNGSGPVQVIVPLCSGPFELFWNDGGLFTQQIGIAIKNPFGQTIFSYKEQNTTNNRLLFSGVADCVNPLCYPPTNIVANTVTTSGATLSWTPDGPSPVSWDVYIVTKGSPAPVATTTPTRNTTTLPLLINTLNEDTDYDVYVRAVCSFAGSNVWSEPFSFKTIETCPSPTAINTTATTLNSISLSWTGSAPSYQYIALPSGLAPPSSTDTAWSLGTINSNSVTISGLFAATNYNIYVRSVCTPDLSFSKASKITVNTQTCLPTEKCTYTFKMTTNQEGGWSILNQEMEVRQAGIVVATFGSDFGSNQGFEKSIQIPLCSGVPFEVFWKPGGLYFMEIGLAIEDPTGKGVFYLPPTNLNSLKPGTVIFTDNTVCTPQTCLAPTDLKAISVLNTSATITWKENNSATSWDVLVLPATSLPPNQNVAGWNTITTTPFTITTGLSPNTKYKVYVRSNCSTTDKSYWSFEETFTTLLGVPTNYCDYTFVLKTAVAGSPWHPEMSLSVIQDGVVVKKLTGPPAGFSEYPVSVPLLDSKPFELFWNTGGTFDYLLGVTVLDPDGVEIFDKPVRTGEQGTSLYKGTSSCIPNTCGTPIQLYTSNPSNSQITLGWTGVGTPDKYEILILPVNSTPPGTDVAGVIESPINIFIATVASGVVKPGVFYEYYVRAICDSGDRVGAWSNAKKFNLLLSNDECSGAIEIPVSPGTTITSSVKATIAGATQSSKNLTCSGEGYGTVAPDDDVWFEFKATSTAHGIIIGNITGSDAETYTILSYQLFAPNTCQQASSPIICQRFNDLIIARDLTPGLTYKLRVYTFDVTPDRETPDLTIEFRIGITTLPNYIKIDPIVNTTNDIAKTSSENLVNNVLLNGTCGTASNVTFSTGFLYNYQPYGGTGNGIASFDKNGSTFSLKQGIMLATGTAKRGEGPLSGFQGDGGVYWPGWSTASGDDDLNQVLIDNGLEAISLNSTKLEFDFVPTVDKLDFNFVFASQDYGISDCNKVSDAFIFLLTDVDTGVATNIAVVPETTKPVSVVTVNNNEFYNDNFVDGDPNKAKDDCASTNPEYFDKYYVPIDEFLRGGSSLPGESPFASPTNYYGYTKPLKATSAVVPGKKYHIKLAIADLSEFTGGDWGHDSAVFIGSFDSNTIDLGSDLLKSNGTALCVNDSKVLDSKLDKTKFDIVWKKDGVVLDGEKEATYTVRTSGVYEVSTTISEIVCSGPTTNSDSIVVEFYDDFVVGVPTAITECSTATTATFDLTKNQGIILGTLGTNYSLSYFVSEDDAKKNTNPISNPSTYTNLSNPQTIYVRVSTNLNSCFKVVSFDIEVKDLVPQFNITPSFSLCENKKEPITVTPLNFNLTDVTFSWTFNTTALPDVTSIIEADKAGVYEVTVTNSICSAKKSTTVTAITLKQPDFAAIPTLCIGTTAPLLQTTSPNGVVGSWNPATIDTNANAKYTFTPNADQCALPQELEVNVSTNITSNFAPIDPFCSGTTAPILPITSPNGIIGTWEPAVVNNLNNGTYVFKPTNSTCATGQSFDVVVTQRAVPNFASINPLCIGGSVPELLNVSPNGISGTWNPSIINNTVSNTYVFTPNTEVCATTQSLPVTIIPEISVEQQEGCNGNDYQLSAVTVNGSFNTATTTFIWSSDNGTFDLVSGSPQTIILKTIGTYKVVVTTADGCSQTELFTVNSIGCNLPIQKGISPNNDGKNDFFDLSTINVNLLEIFNRYGAKVYSFKNYSNQWYGTTNDGKELPDGTYYYVIQRDGFEATSGWIYILRENR